MCLACIHGFAFITISLEEVIWRWLKKLFNYHMLREYCLLRTSVWLEDSTAVAPNGYSTGPRNSLVQILPLRLTHQVALGKCVLSVSTLLLQCVDNQTGLLTRLLQGWQKIIYVKCFKQLLSERYTNAKYCWILSMNKTAQNCWVLDLG